MIVYAFALHHHRACIWQTNHGVRRHLPCPNQPLVHWNNMASNVRRSKRSRLSPPLPQTHEELQIICAGCSLDLCNSAYASRQCKTGPIEFGRKIKGLVKRTKKTHITQKSVNE